MGGDIMKEQIIKKITDTVKVIDMNNTNKKWCVYMHTNKINNKVYVGQTCQTPTERWDSGHGYKTCTYFYRAINKYGWDNFEHIVFAENLTKDEANKMEKALIILYDTKNPKYLHTVTNVGYKLTPIINKESVETNEEF